MSELDLVEALTVKGGSWTGPHGTNPPTPNAQIPLAPPPPRAHHRIRSPRNPDPRTMHRETVLVFAIVAVLGMLAGIATVELWQLFVWLSQ